MTRVFGYIRLGGPDSVSRDGQTQNIASYCRVNNFELLRMYVDEETGDGRSEESDRIILRPGLQDLLADLAETPIDFVVVFNTSRLWRTEMTKVLIQRELRRYEADVKAVAQPAYSIYDQGRDPSWCVTQSMVDLLVQYEQVSAALKLRRGRLRKAGQGGYAGGRPPLGYKVCRDTNALVIDPDKAEVVRRVFEIVEGDVGGQPSLQRIADTLNGEGYTTAHGKPFQRVQVKRILDRREFYQGSYRYGRVSSDGEHEPLLVDH